MQKTTKSLLTKIFVLLTVIFCVFALALGAVGCAKEETKSVTKVSVNGTIITVEYSDGSKENLTVDGEGETQKCGHNEYVLLTSEPVTPTYKDGDDINSKICRANIYACAVCNHVYAAYEEHVLEASKQAATCAEKGWDGKKCKNCGYIEGEMIDTIAHDFQTFELVVESSVNKCTDVWFSGEKVCKSCGLTYLVVEQPTGHTYTNIRVGTYATNDVAAVLVADCTVCGATKVQVKELYTLASKEAKEEYKKTVVGNYSGYHTATYAYEYEGVTYNVAEDFREDHTLTVDDYTTERYPEISIKTGEPEVSCINYVKAIYICKECNHAVDVQVKKAHTVSDDAKYTKTTANCEKDGVETYACEVEGCTGTVTKGVKAYEHNFAKLVANSLKENADGTINVTFECTNTYNGAACEKTKALNNIKDYEKKDANCSKDGYIKYTTEDGQEATLVLKADGKHVLGGYNKTVEKGEELAYEDVKEAAISYYGDEPATCGISVKPVFICEECTNAVNVIVTRNHVEINVSEVKEADCVNEGSYKYNCAYTDCVYHTTKETGTIPTSGHDFEFVGVVPEKKDIIKVVCSVEGCKYHSETEFTYSDLVQERSMTCSDYKAGKSNSNTYKITVDGKDYNVVEKIANNIHVLNGKKVAENSTFTVGTKGTFAHDGQFANCKDSAKGIFICEECNNAVDIMLIGECQTPDNLAAATQKDDISCEKAAYNYWICSVPGCGMRHNLDKISDATGHDFEIALSEDKKIATLTCKNEGCTLGDITVELAKLDKPTEEKTCETITYTYTYKYISATVEGYTQDVKIKVVADEGSHTYLMNADGKKKECKYVEYDSNGNIVREGYGYYCTACNTYEIISWMIPGARPWETK